MNCVLSEQSNCKVDHAHRFHRQLEVLSRPQRALKTSRLQNEEATLMPVVPTLAALLSPASLCVWPHGKFSMTHGRSKRRYADGSAYWADIP